jgi:hypothetical protein
MSLKQILAKGLLAYSMLQSPAYSEQSLEGYIAEKALNKIEEKASERLIERIMERHIIKPSLENILQKNIRNENPGIIYLDKIDKKVEEDFFFRGIPVYVSSMNIDPSSDRNGMIRLKEETFFIVSHKERGINYLGYSTLDSMKQIAYKNDLPIRSPKNFKPLRVNQTESDVFVLHPSDTKLRSIQQKAVYASGKEDELEPLEDSLVQTSIIEGGKKLVTTAIQKITKDPKAEEHLKTAEEKYKERETEVMNEFAREINPNFIATKIPLYNARTFGEIEVGRAVSFEFENPENKDIPFVIYLKPVLGIADTGICSLEVLLRSD